ncbi:MAG TPA: hypothetical protein PKK79_03440, partial [Syntrophorhabdaceae bacterium]|nr:hypothetical protein [Syntrophorhabdaceae bacterium]
MPILNPIKAVRRKASGDLTPYDSRLTAYDRIKDILNPIKAVRRKASGDLTPYDSRLTAYDRIKDILRREEKKIAHGSLLMAHDKSYIATTFPLPLRERVTSTTFPLPLRERVTSTTFPL